MNWKRIREIARWEYVLKVRSKAFIVGVMLTPMMMIAGFTLPAMFADSAPDAPETIAVIDTTHTLVAPLTQYFATHATLKNKQPAYTFAEYLRPGENVDSAIKRADRAALNDTVEGAIVMRDSAGHMRATYRSANPGNIRLTSTMEEALDKIIQQRRLSAAGIDTAVYSKVSESVELHTVKVTERGSSSGGGFSESFFTSYILSLLLMILVLTTGGSLVRSLVEEKSNRIMEILVSSSTPQELMWGKLLGLSGLGLTQLLIWIVIGLGGASYLAASQGVLSKISAVLAILPLLAVYLMLGYIFYAAIFIAVGSLVSTEQEAQVMNSYLVILLIIPTFVSMGVLTNPNAGYLTVLSYIPVFTPSLMMQRIVTKMPAPGEIIGTILVLAACTAVVIYFASKIFRTAILLTGKRPTVREIARWFKAA